MFLENVSQISRRNKLRAVKNSAETFFASLKVNSIEEKGRSHCETHEKLGQRVNFEFSTDSQ